MLLPTLDKILKENSDIMRANYLNILRRELLGITKAFPKELDIPFLRLTRTEMKVCQFIQAGYSGKEVADALNISFETIQTHRKNIRKKLGLRDKKISLYTFLSTRRSLGEIIRP
jgi:DNA-binding NarL/FixJ family response regulator